MFHIHT
ncbi:hypothetical protein D030_4011A, partial [Vibrio parahaemolyticus AQ3810]